MRDVRLQKLIKGLFKSPKEDWTDRIAWQRRALSWKLMAIGLKHKNNDPKVIEMYDRFMRSDFVRAPNEGELLQIAAFFDKYCKDNPNSKIIIP